MNFQATGRIAFLVLLAWAWTPTPGFAGSAKATIEAKLIYATNVDDRPKEQALAELEPKFKPDFGYKHYRLLGEKSVVLKEDESAVLELGQQFELSLKHKGAKEQFRVLQIDLFHKKKWLLYFKASVKQRSEPIFIKGPATEQGLIIIALTAK